jgi:ribose transport system substrate-binding protein
MSGRALLRISLAVCAFIVMATAAACDRDGGGGATTSGGGASAKKYTIAVIPKGTTHEFWKSVHAGAAKAGE